MARYKWTEQRWSEWDPTIEYPAYTQFKWGITEYLGTNFPKAANGTPGVRWIYADSSGVDGSQLVPLGANTPYSYSWFNIHSNTGVVVSPGGAHLIYQGGNYFYERTGENWTSVRQLSRPATLFPNFSAFSCLITTEGVVCPANIGNPPIWHPWGGTPRAMRGKYFLYGTDLSNSIVMLENGSYETFAAQLGYGGGAAVLPSSTDLAWQSNYSFDGVNSPCTYRYIDGWYLWPSQPTDGSYWWLRKIGTKILYRVQPSRALQQVIGKVGYGVDAEGIARAVKLGLLVMPYDRLY